MFNQASLDSCSSICQYQLLLNTWSFFFNQMSIFTQLLNFFSITYQYVKDRLPSTTKLYCWDIDEILRGLWCSLSQQGYWYIIDHTLILITNWEDVGVLHDQTPLQQGIERTLIKYWYWWKFEKTFLGSIHGQEGDRDAKEVFWKKNPCEFHCNLQWLRVHKRVHIFRENCNLKINWVHNMFTG